jgi:arylformamidase
MAWSGTDVNDIEQNYNARLTVPEFVQHVARCRTITAKVKSDLNAISDIPYGSHPRECFDWYPCGKTGAPVHIFIHGGFWRANDKSDFGLVAGPVNKAEANVAIISYPLCPERPLAQIVQSAVRAVQYIVRYASDEGADTSDLTIAGHSAGAHLSAMVLSHDWAAEGWSAHPFRAAVLISGIFELEPVLQISVNREMIHLTEIMVPNLSPMRFPPSDVDVLLPVGGDEAPMWMKQSEKFAEAIRSAGGKARYVEIPGRNHCNLMETFENSSYPLPRMTVDHLYPR